MGLKYCNISLINENDVFFSGKFVKGIVNLNLEKPKKVSELSLKVFGEAKVQWTETYFVGTRTINVYYKGLQNYFTEDINLLADGRFPKEGVLTVIPIGEHRMEFSAHIADHSPSSYEGLYGSVRYKAKMTMKRPYKRNKTTKLTFSVVKQLDLNANPLLNNPYLHKVTKRFHVMFMNTGHLEIETLVPTTGFVPGHMISLKCMLKNRSTVDLNYVKLSLKRYTTNKATSPFKKKRTESKCISKEKSGPLKKGQDDEFTVALPIPPITPSSDDEMKLLVRHNYFIQIKVGVTGIHRNMKTGFPIIIGTVPFKTIPEASTSMDDGNNPVFDAPPSYEEAQIESRIAEDDDKGQKIDLSKGFVPKYPVFYPEKNKF